MRAPQRSLWTALALTLALALSASAAEQRAPSGAISGVPAVNAAVPAAPRLPDAAGASLSVPNLPALPSLPGQTASVPQGPSAAPQGPAAQAAGPQVHAAAPGIPGPVAGPAQASLANERAGKILEQLSPDHAGKISGEAASDLAGKLIDPRGAGASLVRTAGPSLSGTGPSPMAKLAPWQKHSGGETWLAPQDPKSPKAPREERPSVSDRLHYADLYFKNLYFYIVTNIVNKWGPYEAYWLKMKASGTPAPVSRPRAFFAHMRVFGQTGQFYVPGFTPLEDHRVIYEAMQTYDKYFDAPYLTPRERKAFEGFVMRASLYNKERRAASKFRATVRDNLLKASTMTKDKIAPFFDSLPTVDKTAEFQSSEADAILEQFKAMVLEEVAKEPKDAEDRITGVILIGSFALGAATPKSDFDVEPLTANGGGGRVRDFAARVQKRWEEMGRQSINPVSFHYFGYLESRWEIRAIHHEPYLIFSPDQKLVDKLSMRPGEPPSHVPSRKLTLWGRFLRWAQYTAVYITSLTVRQPKAPK
jgi:hypothetical protein